ncbi:imelysin family protein [Kiloniella sp.]|uniref:imelysin family protein n=1 Tax=Kiloniella sp. TaxID=1938587 RepID=UPI003B0144A2
MLSNPFQNSKKALLILVGFCVLPISAMAQDLSDDQEPKPDFGPMIKQVIERSILPGYEALRIAAHTEERSISNLCQSPNLNNLIQARKGYKNLVSAWASVEIFRLGPAIKNNRQEKLFFWPDRKSIGLKQVRKLIDTENQTALSYETLRTKSVAVQGLLALEYVLFGKGADLLSEGIAQSYRCKYGETISQAMGRTALDISKDWSKPNGYADLMYNPGSDNPVYRTQEEVVQDLLRVSSEMIQSVRDLKIHNSIKSTPEKSKPKRAPLWRSNLTIHAIKENLNSVAQLLNAGGLGSFTPRYTKSLGFELEQTNKFLTQLEQRSAPWVELVKNEDAHKTLNFLLIPLEGAKNVTTDLIPAELGLSLGFNSLDGD